MLSLFLFGSWKGWTERLDSEVGLVRRVGAKSCTRSDRLLWNIANWQFPSTQRPLGLYGSYTLNGYGILSHFSDDNPRTNSDSQCNTFKREHFPRVLVNANPCHSSGPRSMRISKLNPPTDKLVPDMTTLRDCGIGNLMFITNSITVKVK